MKITTVIIRLLVLASPLLLNDLYLPLVPKDATTLSIVLDVLVYIGWQTTLLYVAYEAGWFSWNSLGINLTQVKQWLWGVVLFVCVFVAYTGITIAFMFAKKYYGITVESFWYFPLPQWHGVYVFLYVLYLSITAGIYEEIIYRGIAIHQLKNLTSNTGILVIVSTLLFVAIHWSMGPGTWMEAGLWGALWAYLYIKTHSLLPIMIAHVLYDVASIYGLHEAIAHSIGL
ncbi:MAG TPA: CPBP family intramembrane metalloprotease [Spirochaetota bacterium]|nr:CPBP family intramembrane metalloprotease [Spirochaetota bacterium]HOM11022.1 CPBP family intramembrane metalloprotease [Spirochaetota bacterium]HPP50779.1 CPBP family intramembrane metalloprotease [Spirochaetota bacterium]